MKIDTDLRLAIRSAEKAQPYYNDSWSEQRERETAAIADLFKRKPALAKTAQRATAAIERHQKRVQVEVAKIRAIGLDTGLRTVGNEDAFRKVGGRLPDRKKRWKFDAVMAELAAADEKEAPRILKKYGIKWN